MKNIGHHAFRAEPQHSHGRREAKGQASAEDVRGGMPFEPDHIAKPLTPARDQAPSSTFGRFEPAMGKERRSDQRRPPRIGKRSRHGEHDAPATEDPRA
jgi:hypothetical protein